MVISINSLTDSNLDCKTVGRDWHPLVRFSVGLAVLNQHPEVRFHHDEVESCAHFLASFRAHAMVDFGPQFSVF